jgi:outer membrane autotransporter protein
VGDKITLLEAEKSLSETLPTTRGTQGILELQFNLVSDDKRLWGEVADIRTSEKSKALSEGALSGLIGLNQSIDLAAGAGISAMRDATRGNSQSDGNHAFIALDGSDSRYHTGSHVDLKSRALLVGLAGQTTLDTGRLAVGAFVTHGEGDYDTFNRFTNAADVRGQGETSHTGVGLLAKLDLPGTKNVRPYVEASLQVGRVETEFRSADLLPEATSVRYETRSNYAGTHVGVGAVWEIPDAAALNLYGQYLFTHRNGDKIKLDAGIPIEFDAVESQRLRLGGRYTWTINQVQPYVGMAWEKEFDSETRAKSYGHTIESPSFKGTTRTFEFGMSIHPSLTYPFSFDFSLQHHTGKREGNSGGLQVKYRF